jgi:hypothetical protein
LLLTGYVHLRQCIDGCRFAGAGIYVVITKPLLKKLSCLFAGTVTCTNVLYVPVLKKRGDLFYPAAAGPFQMKAAHYEKDALVKAILYGGHKGRESPRTQESYTIRVVVVNNRDS